MTDDHEKDEVLAAEYAIGLLEGADREAARSRVRSDASFAAQVVAWERRFAQMLDLPAEDPPASVKIELMKRLFPTNEPTPFWQRVGIWQALTGAATAMLLLLIVSPLLVGSEPETGPLYTTEIVSESADFRVVAVVDMARDEIILTRTAGAPPQGRILQVWAHGPDAPAQSVGLWPEGDSVRLPLPEEIAQVQGTLTIGVSEEPPGGSTTGSPSGRVFGTSDIADVSN